MGRTFEGKGREQRSWQSAGKNRKLKSLDKKEKSVRGRKLAGTDQQSNEGGKGGRKRVLGLNVEEVR